MKGFHLTKDFRNNFERRLNRTIYKINFCFIDVEMIPLFLLLKEPFRYRIIIIIMILNIGFCDGCEIYHSRASFSRLNIYLFI